MTVKPLHVVMVNYNHYERFPTAEALFEHYYNLDGWARGLTDAGAGVTVFQRFHHDLEVWRDGVAFHLFSEYGPRLRSWQVPRRFHRAIAAACRHQTQAGKDVVVHVGGMVFPWQTRRLHGLLPKGSVLVLQHHGEQPWSGIRGWVQKQALSVADGFLFTTRELAEPWLRRSVIRSQDRVFEVMEGSSPFSRRDPVQARRETGLEGDPIVLWTANLDANKDPLTVLDGFEGILDNAPRARLYMAFRRDSLLGEVNARLSSSPRLGAAVRLLGRIPRSRIAAYYQSADVFVQGSRREAAGLALLDALACGVVPVVTDIPSFRVMTDSGRLGALWKEGDSQSLAHAFLAVCGRPFSTQSQACRRFFEQRLSFTAIGRRASTIYRQVLDHRP